MAWPQTQRSGASVRADRGPPAQRHGGWTRPLTSSPRAGGRAASPHQSDSRQSVCVRGWPTCWARSLSFSPSRTSSSATRSSRSTTDRCRSASSLSCCCNPASRVARTASRASIRAVASAALLSASASDRSRRARAAPGPPPARRAPWPPRCAPGSRLGRGQLRLQVGQPLLLGLKRNRSRLGVTHRPIDGGRATQRERAQCRQCLPPSRLRVPQSSSSLSLRPRTNGSAAATA